MKIADSEFPQSMPAISRDKSPDAVLQLIFTKGSSLAGASKGRLRCRDSQPLDSYVGIMFPHFKGVGPILFKKDLMKCLAPSTVIKRASRRLMSVKRFERISAAVKLFEHSRNRGVVHWPLFIVRHQILLADIGDIAVFQILGEKMVEWLVFCRANIFGDRLIPFLAVRKDRINIENHAAKFENTVAHDITNAKSGVRNWGCRGQMPARTVTIKRVHKSISSAR